MNDLNYIGQQQGKVSWGSIFAGSLVAIAVQATLLTLGSAIGFTAYDPAHGDSIGAGSFLRFGIFTLVASLLSLFAGSYAAGRLAGSRDRFVAGAHGVSVWAVVSVLTIFMVSSGVGSALRLAGTVVGGAASGIATVGGAAASNVDVDGRDLVAGARQILKDTGKAELNPDQLARDAKKLPTQAARAQARDGGPDAEGVVSSELGDKAAAFDRDAAANVLAKRLNVSKAEALSLIGQGEEKADQLTVDAKQKLEEVKAKGVEVAQAGTTVAARVSWVAFFSLVLGAIAAAFGAVIGARANVRYVADERVGLRDAA
jgi:hypothetical protein